MIPKTIHYCWFGGNPLPESAMKCIESWRKYFPDYKIIEWNEQNFDINAIPYTSEAYKAGKYAFVSDYARFKILHDHGGIYFDTDVEVIKSMDDIIARGGFMGRELGEELGGDVNPGLGIGISAKHPIYAELLEKYSTLHFQNSDGSLNTTTIVKYTTELLKKHGLRATNEIQTIGDITIYPKDFFNPLNDNTGELEITTNTRSIHWYAKTWLNINPFRIKISRMAHRCFGIGISKTIRKFLKIR